MDQLNQKLLSLFEDRSRVVGQIQELKGPGLGLKNFDFEREKALFGSLIPQKPGVSLREWLAFSVLMEAHAGAPENYPAWSEGVHLLESSQRIEHRINPVLLKFYAPEIFASLRLSSHFAFLHSN